MFMSAVDSVATFTFPTRILFGEGARRQLAEEMTRLGITRPLIVTDSGIVEAGVADFATDRIRNATLFAGVHANPSEADCQAGLQLYRTHFCDGVIALGGGSAIDAGKAIRLLVTHPGSIGDYDVTTGGTLRITANLPPIVAIPTTAGTGSEVGRAALIQIPATGRKTAVISPYLLPSLSICDPELTYGLSPLMTAATGMDALCHAVESYLSPTFHPICDGIACEALRHLAPGLEAAVRNGNDVQARRSMMVAALMAGISFHKGLGAVHALSHALGGEGRAHHGTLNAILLPHVLRFNRTVSQGRMSDLAMLMGLSRTVDAAGHFITLSEILLQRLPIPKRLSEVEGLDRSRIDHYARLALQDHCSKTNPRPAAHEDYVGLLNEAW
jgi:alcohol dehydrogenase class IV